MAKEKTKEAKMILERDYIVPLKSGFMETPDYSRAKRAIRVLKMFVAKHMKVENRDVRKVKLDKWLNHEMWFRGMRKPPIKIRIKVKKYDDGIVKAELFEIPEVLKFRIAREGKSKSEAEKKKAEKVAEKAAATPEGSAIAGEKTAEAKTEEKKDEKTKEEQKEVLKEAKKVQEKMPAHAEKHVTSANMKKTAPVRKALKK